MSQNASRSWARLEGRTDVGIGKAVNVTDKCRQHVSYMIKMERIWLQINAETSQQAFPALLNNMLQGRSSLIFNENVQMEADGLLAPDNQWKPSAAYLCSS